MCCSTPVSPTGPSSPRSPHDPADIRRAIKATIPERDDQLAHRRRRGTAAGRPYAFDPDVYKRRNVVERGFNRFKHWHGLASRFDKTAVCYLGGLTLASLLLWAGS